jgi:hypothetical protein
VPQFDPATRPVSAEKSAVGDLLRLWFANGTAAGNVGDFYENRDGGHSPLDMTPYPQLQRWVYPADGRKYNTWAAQAILLPGVVFGNSSTAAPVTKGGSNVLKYYTWPQGLAFLYGQYVNNNLFMYPAHQDHLAGRAGNPFYGDVFPTNTPYLITSQGSSGTDQPFMRAVPKTLAAFRPEVKRMLVESGLLMPTVQMILRINLKQPGVANPHKDDIRDFYLSGKAHPTVFEGGSVDERKMAEMAHDIEPGTIPPLVQLKVVREDQPVAGRDFFDPAPTTERLADTPCVIARIFRGSAYTRRIVVSAEGSIDVNSRPLTYHWAVLRGDAGKIKIIPIKPDGSVVEIVAAYPERRPVAPGSAIESNRVDIGAFVHNGAYFSAPAFATFFALDNEARAYDESGKVLEIGYGMGEAGVTVANWQGLLDLLATDTPAAGLLKKSVAPEELAAIAAGADEYRAALAAVEPFRQARKAADAPRQQAGKDLDAAKAKQAAAQQAVDKSASAENKTALDQAKADVAAATETVKTADADIAAAQKAVDQAVKAADDVLARNQPALKSSLKAWLEKTLDAMLRSPTFYSDNEPAIRAAAGGDVVRKATLTVARKSLAMFGVIKDEPAGFTLMPIHPTGTTTATAPASVTRPPTTAATATARGKTASAPAAPAPPLADGLTRYERAMIQQFNAHLLTGVLYPGLVSPSSKAYYADPMLTAPKAWRDVYHYSPAGDLIGWTRYDGVKPEVFNADGVVALELDSLGRCVRGRAVRYIRDPSYKPPAAFGDIDPAWAPLRETPGPEIIEYRFAGDTDYKGVVKGR